jgi:hypothetical protein
MPAADGQLEKGLILFSVWSMFAFNVLDWSGARDVAGDA